jgi:virulence factor
MRVGVVGLGDIAQKAYLPVLATREDVELVLCTRNGATLATLARRYRAGATATTLAELLDRHVEAAFVHAATEAHVELCSALLRAGVHVYVDKPLAYSYAEAERLVALSEQSGRLLMVGFNRRFAPMYAALQAQERRLVLLQKHRAALPEQARRFVFDDFIHVVDTLRFLAPGQVTDVRVAAFQADGLLRHVLLQLDGAGFSLLGLMNRESGAAEETLEVMGPGQKWVVRGLNTTTHYANGAERLQTFGDWEPVLARRGFPQIVDHFLRCARGEEQPSQPVRDALETHALCERIVREIAA